MIKKYVKIFYLIYFSKFGKIHSLFNYFISSILTLKISRIKKKVYKSFLLKKKISNDDSLKKILYEINTNGYYKCNLDDFSIDNTILVNFDNLKKNPGEKINKKTNKEFFENLYEYKYDDDISKLSLNENFINIAALYLKNCPIISDIQFLKSNVIKNNDFISSMNWHLDSHHKKLIKIIILNENTDNTNGPTCFLDKITTKKILGFKKYFSSPIYFKDNELKDVVEDFNEKIKYFSGKRGDVLMIDTSKCFHMGSRTKKTRHQIFMTYTPIKTFDLTWLKKINEWKELNKDIEKILVN